MNIPQIQQSAMEGELTTSKVRHPLPTRVTWLYNCLPLCNTCNTCIEKGQPVADCNLYDCTVGNSQISSLPIDNTCTYEGEDYNCLKDVILPWMQGQTEAGEADFSVHVGDIIKGNGDGGNRRCQDSSFTSRKNLFSGVDNFLVTPGGMLNVICIMCLCVVALNILT